MTTSLTKTDQMVAADFDPNARPKPRDDLFCPRCFAWHVDRGVWRFKLHHKHLCTSCGNVWRVKGDYVAGVECVMCERGLTHSNPDTCPKTHRGTSAQVRR